LLAEYAPDDAYDHDFIAATFVLHADISNFYRLNPNKEFVTLLDLNIKQGSLYHAM